jgi:acyl-CoA thioester hydrolase
MADFTYTLRVPYADTDVMGFLHHSNYARYYETARWEMFRALGIPYREIEDSGYLFPVVGMQIKYIKPAHYDDQLTIITRVSEVRGPRVVFNYKMYDSGNSLINKAEIHLALIEKESKKLSELPEKLKRKIQ